MVLLSVLNGPEGVMHTTSSRTVAPSARLGGWGKSILSSDLPTYMHCERVAVYAVQVARALGFDEQRLATVRLGAALHDIGKIRIPADILHKEGRLTPEEFHIVKRHPVWGLDLLDTVECPGEVRAMVCFHHEKYDGTGYPAGLSGDQIPLAATIICVADVYDALTTRRSYRPALPRARALLEMHLRQGWWHPDVYAAFCRAIGSGSARRPALAPAPIRRARAGSAVKVEGQAARR